MSTVCQQVAKTLKIAKRMRTYRINTDLWKFIET